MVGNSKKIAAAVSSRALSGNPRALRLARRTLRGKLPVMMAGLVALAPLSIATAYVIAPGDTLSGIADRYGVSVSSLAALNGIVNPDLIFAGQELRTDGAASAGPVTPPTTTTHAVQPGETLTAIANQYRVSISSLIDLNDLGNPDLIQAGDVLTVPPSQPGPSVAAAQEQGRAALADAEREFGLPHGLLLALGWQESGFNQAMVSHAGAVGVAQLLPSTAEWAELLFLPGANDWRNSPRDNARLGASILSYYLSRSGGDVEISLAAYFQGWRSVEEEGMYDETAVYVANVLALVPQFAY